MYYIRFNDPANEKIMPWDAVMMIAHSSVRVAMLASIQPRFDVTRRLLWHETVNCLPIPLDFDSQSFPAWLEQYRKDRKQRVLTAELPTGKLFLAAVRKNISDLISAVLEKEDDRLILFSDDTDGLVCSSTKVIPPQNESLLLLGMRPYKKGFFEGGPVSRYQLVPDLPYSCEAERIYLLRKAFAKVNVEEVKALFADYPYSDANTGGLFASACFAIMIDGGFPGTLLPRIKELFRFLVAEQNADVNFRLSKEEDGTVLHLLAACFGAHRNTLLLVQLLKQFGADLKIRNNRGDTPFDTAKNHLQYELLADALNPEN